MPRVRYSKDDRPPPRRVPPKELVQRFADELRSNRSSAQPVIVEMQFGRGQLWIRVIWDAWERFCQEDRTNAILRAYEQVEGREFRDRIALANGLTVPEAYSASMLPFRIIPALRKGDPVTLDQCREAMIAEGASTIFAADEPQLRFGTAEEADAARARLAGRLPGSEPVWVVTQDAGRVEEWAER